MYPCIVLAKGFHYKQKAYTTINSPFIYNRQEYTSYKVCSTIHPPTHYPVTGLNLEHPYIFEPTISVLINQKVHVYIS